MVTELVHLKAKGGRIFFIGVGGSAANASHAVNDFRKIANIQAYAPTDNVAELTARTNDQGWRYTFADWLAGSRLESRDLVWVLSVGGGSEAVSPNILDAVVFANMLEVPVWGIVGSIGGATSEHGRRVVRVAGATPYVESLQLAVLHCIVTHPALSENP